MYVSDSQVVKEIAVTSRDVSAEDSLYETVKELKDPPTQPGLPNGTIQLSPDEPPHNPPALLNGHLSPSTPERGPLCTGVESEVNSPHDTRYVAYNTIISRYSNAIIINMLQDNRQRKMISVELKNTTCRHYSHEYQNFICPIDVVKAEVGQDVRLERSWCVL